MATPEVDQALDEIDQVLQRHLAALALDLEDIEGRHNLMVGDWCAVVEITDLDDDAVGWVVTHSPLRMRYHSLLGLLHQAIDDLAYGG